MYIITAKLKSKETGKLIGYMFRDENTGAECIVDIKTAKDSCLYVKNATLSNWYYRVKSGYPEIPTIEVNDKKKKRSKSAAKKQGNSSNMNKTAVQSGNSYRSNNGNSKQGKYNKRNTVCVQRSTADKQRNNSYSSKQGKDRNLSKKSEDVKKRKEALKVVNKAGDDGYTNMYTRKRGNPNSNSVPEQVTRHKLKSDMDWANIRGERYIGACLTIRTAARAGRLNIDTTKHDANEGWNIQLFKIIKTCRMSVKGFIRQYLSVLQPYALEEFETDDDTEKSEGNVWVVDIAYSVGLLIKMDIYDKESPLIISFHESNVRGGLRRTNGKLIDDNELCALIPESVKEENINGKKAVQFLAYIQHGFIRARLSKITTLYGRNAVVVRYKTIRERYDWYIKEMYKSIDGIYYDEDDEAAIIDLDADADVNSINRLRYENFSFPAFGHIDLNYIYFLEDAARLTKDFNKKAEILDAGDRVKAKLGCKRLDEIRCAIESREAKVDDGGVLKGVLRKDEKA